MAQTARPSSDVSNNNWVPSPVYIEINEVNPDDSTYVSTTIPSGGTFQVELSPLLPPGPGPETLTVRMQQVCAGFSVVTVQLLQGGVPVAIRTFYPTTTFQDYNIYLTPSEIASITDYQDLQLLVSASGSASGSCSGSASGSWGSVSGAASGSGSGSFSGSGSGSGSQSGSGSGGGTVVVSCCPNPMPTTLTLTFSGADSDCDCINGLSIPLTYNPETESWDGTPTVICGSSGTTLVGFGCGWALGFQVGTACSFATLVPGFSGTCGVGTTLITGTITFDPACGGCPSGSSVTATITG